MLIVCFCLYNKCRNKHAYTKRSHTKCIRWAHVTKHHQCSLTPLPVDTFLILLLSTRNKTDTNYIRKNIKVRKVNKAENRELTYFVMRADCSITPTQERQLSSSALLPHYLSLAVRHRTAKILHCHSRPAFARLSHNDSIKRKT